MGFLKDLEWSWKHRGQVIIQQEEGSVRDASKRRVYFQNSYNHIEVVRRGTDMIVDSASEIDVNIAGKLSFSPFHDKGKLKPATLEKIINFRPNAYEDVSSFRRQLMMDFILTGNAFQYFEAKTNSLFHLPSKNIQIHTDDNRKVSHYTMNDQIKFSPEEIIHTKDNSAESVYEGRSRLYCTIDTIKILKSMLDYQETFFDNGAVPGLIIQTPNILGDKIKRRMLAAWRARYNPKSGGKSPMILDGDLKVNPLSQTKFSELDFADSIVAHETKILKALGVPPILLESGNNANIRPNIQLFYEMTVLPIVVKFISSYERFFGFDMEPEVVKVRALRPELRDAANYYTGLVNNGIMTANEARQELRLDPVDDEGADELRIPQNIAGSATDPKKKMILPKVIRLQMETRSNSR